MSRLRPESLQKEKEKKRFGRKSRADMWTFNGTLLAIFWQHR
jgi:hypothetical protein